MIVKIYNKKKHDNLFFLFYHFISYCVFFDIMFLYDWICPSTKKFCVRLCNFWYKHFRLFSPCVCWKVPTINDYSTSPTIPLNSESFARGSGTMNILYRSLHYFRNV